MKGVEEQPSAGGQKNIFIEDRGKLLPGTICRVAAFFFLAYRIADEYNVISKKYLFSKILLIE